MAKPLSEKACRLICERLGIHPDFPMKHRERKGERVTTYAGDEPAWMVVRYAEEEARRWLA